MNTIASSHWLVVADPEPEVSVADIDAAPVNLPAQMGPPTPDAYRALNEKFTIVSEENVGLKGDIDTLKRRVRTAEILDSLIQPYARSAFRFMCAYCAFVGFILILNGWKVADFSLSDSVLTLMVGSTAATVIGLVGMVLTGIFVGARKQGGG